MVKKGSVSESKLDIVFIGAKELDKTSLIFKIKQTLKDSLDCREVLFKEYTAERKDDVLLMTSPHENGFITGDGSILAQKGDIFVVMFKASADSQSFIEAAMLLELLLPLKKHRVVLLGDSSAVPPEKRVECKADMSRKTKAQMGIEYTEVSEEAEGFTELTEEIISISRRNVFRKSLSQKLTQLLRGKGRSTSAKHPAKMYIAAKYPYNALYWRAYELKSQ